MFTSEPVMRDRTQQRSEPPALPSRLYVPLDGPVGRALAKRARRQDRYPKVEAARIIRERLEADGDLEPQP